MAPPDRKRSSPRTVRSSQYNACTPDTAKLRPGAVHVLPQNLPAKPSSPDVVAFINERRMTPRQECANALSMCAPVLYGFVSFRCGWLAPTWRTTLLFRCAVCHLPISMWYHVRCALSGSNIWPLACSIDNAERRCDQTALHCVSAAAKNSNHSRRCRSPLTFPQLFRPSRLFVVAGFCPLRLRALRRVHPLSLLDPALQRMVHRAAMATRSSAEPQPAQPHHRRHHTLPTACVATGLAQSVPGLRLYPAFFILLHSLSVWWLLACSLPCPQHGRLPRPSCIRFHVHVSHVQ